MGYTVDDVLCMVCPEPPRFLQLASLTRIAKKLLPWLALATLQSAIVTVPICLWRVLGRKRLVVPGTQLALHPAEGYIEGCCCLILLLALIHSSSSYLLTKQQQQAARKHSALTPESIIGDNVSWHRSWYAKGPNIPQGDASSLVVDQSMQQSRHASPQKYTKLFQHIVGVKQRLYGSSVTSSIEGPHDLGTAAAEINRLCDAVGIAKLEGGIDVKLLQQKLEEVEAAIG